MAFKKYYYENVTGIGNVAVSRHAQERAQEAGITESDFATVLLKGQTIPDGQAVVWRELNGVRIVIVKRPEPLPWSGAGDYGVQGRTPAKSVAARRIRI